MDSATLTSFMVYDDLALIKLRRQGEIQLRRTSIIFRFGKLTFIQILIFGISFGSTLHEQRTEENFHIGICHEIIDKAHAT